MSEKKKPEQAENVAAQGLPITVHTQYIRDLSFENPNAPDTLRPSGDQPDIDVNIGMDARKLPEDQSKGLPNLYEVVLNAQATAKRGEAVMFMVEMQYGMLVTIGESVPEDNHHPLLLIEIPRMAFPFVRQILSEVTQQGGYPPLYLNPVDFHALYMQRFGEDIKKAQEEAQEAAKN